MFISETTIALIYCCALSYMQCFENNNSNDSTFEF